MNITTKDLTTDWLELARIATSAAAAIRLLNIGKEAQTESIATLSAVLPQMVSTDDLKSISPERVDTFKLTVLSEAASSLGDMPDNLREFSLQLEDLRLDLLKIADGVDVSESRASRIYDFCLRLAEKLISAVGIPHPPGGAIRIA